jgi:hypothetical protein
MTLTFGLTKKEISHADRHKPTAQRGLTTNKQTNKQSHSIHSDAITNLSTEQTITATVVGRPSAVFPF